MKLRVTFKTPVSKYINKSFEIVETYDMTPQSNGFVPDYKLRASALNLTIVKVEEIQE